MRALEANDDLTYVQNWVSQLIQSVLGTGQLSETLHQQLQTYIERSLRPLTEEPTLYTLPILGCQACGGDPRQAMPLIIAWHLLLLVIKLLDDIEDRELVENMPVVTNIATGLLAIIPLILNELRSFDVPSERVQQITLELHRMMLRGCAGQHADLVSDQAKVWDMDPATWLEIARAKSGEFFAWAAWAGAMITGADETAQFGLREYGYHLGVLVQVADDYNDIWTPSGISDLANGRPNLPICYAFWVAKGQDRARLEDLLTHTVQGLESAEAELQQFLIELGAQTYLLVAGRLQHQQARTALEHAVSPSNRGPLRGLLDRIFPIISFEKGTPA